ncbi:MAG: prepilin-type N-terminal cleavage/methylation domain-containing protein [Gammaproteobacteria bacterium]
MQNSKGFTLLEMLLVMSIIAVILIGVTRYYESAATSHKENEAVRLILALKAAGERYRVGQINESTDILPNLINRNLVPVSAKTNPWGGTVTAAMAADGKITVTLATIPAAVCRSLVSIISTDIANSTATCSAADTDATGDFAVNF